jgi:hypothetical protein
MPGPSD